MMKAHALTFFPVLLTAACGATTTTTVEEDVIEETQQTSEPKPTKKQPIQVAESVKNPASTPKSTDDSVCTLKSSREDCRDCCQVLGGEACLATCDQKPAANDCRNNGCPGAGESCNYCWTRYVCLARGTIC